VGESHGRWLSAGWAGDREIDKKQRRWLISGIDHHRHSCVNGHGGLNRSAVGKTAISTRGRPQPLTRPALTSLVACSSALRRAILRHGDAGWRLRSPPSLRGGPAHRPACAPYPSIKSTYSKGRARRGFVLRRCIRKADEAWDEAGLVDGLADTRFFRRRTPGKRGQGMQRRLRRPGRWQYHPSCAEAAGSHPTSRGGCIHRRKGTGPPRPDVVSP
jgi:hypothetical protein